MSDQYLFRPALRLLSLSVALLSLCGSLGGCRTPDPAAGQPLLRHGEPGQRPFWNGYAGRFIYPPAFAIADSTYTASSFRVIAWQGADSTTARLPAPWASLAPVWDRLQPGPVRLQIEGRTPAGDMVLQHTVETIKSPGFDGVEVPPYTHPDSAGWAGLEAVYRLGKVRHWIEPGGPDPTYQLWVHPSKLMGVLSQGMLFLSQHTPDPVIATEAKDIALATATFLLDLRDPPGAPLAGWTHSYWDGVERGAHPIYMDEIMSLYPSEAAMAFLDLYDATQDTTWWDAALDIADTYQRVQRSDGTWDLLLLRETGAAARKQVLVPVSVILFLDRLADQYSVDAYADVRHAAFDWIMENPANSFAWDAQFEDTRPKARYKNLSHREAARFAELLFTTSDQPEHLMLARELLRYVEDQFVVWTHEDAVTRTNWFKEGSKWNGNRAGGGKDWFLPAALEQYAFYTPIAGTTSNVIHAYCAAYEATGLPTYRARAQALSRSLVEAQRYHGGGEIPTHLRQTLPEENWLNNSVYAARTLIEATCL